MSTYESVAAESFISTGLVEFFRERIRHFLSLQSVHYELNKNIIKKCTMLPVILTVCLRSFCSPCKYSHYALDHPTRIFASVREKTLCFAKKNTNDVVTQNWKNGYIFVCKYFFLFLSKIFKQSFFVTRFFSLLQNVNTTKHKSLIPILLKLNK